MIYSMILVENFW